MKKTLSIVIVMTALIAMISGCAGTNSSKSDYFGYSNTPPQKERDVNIQSRYSTTTQATDNDWRNPLSDDFYSNSRGSVAYYRATPRYVPVVVPWWDMYYDGFYHRASGVYVTVGYWHPSWRYYNYYWDWYSPWYMHNPYYGYRWVSRPYYYDNWGWYPSTPTKRHRHETPNTVRTFGPSRGTVDPTAVSYGSASSTNRSDSRGSRGPSSGTSTGNTGNTGTTTIFKPQDAQVNTPERSTVNRPTQTISTTPSSGTVPRVQERPTSVPSSTTPQATQAPASRPSTPSSAPSSAPSVRSQPSSSGSSSSGSSSSGSSSSGSSSSGSSNQRSPSRSR